MTKPSSATTLSPVRHSVHVAVEPARAFEIFMGHVREWWNRAYTANPTKAAIADVVFETKQGGRWYERGADGSECEWASVLESEPPYRLLVNWHIAGQPTQLEVTFAGPAPRRTDVTIVHSGFEAFDDGALRMRDMHDDSWRDLLERYSEYLHQHQAGGHAETSEGADGPAPRSVTDGETVLATMDMATTPERVFRALTTDETERWWGAPDTYQATAWKSDLRVGGQWSVDIRLADGSSFPASGDYLELDAPRRIVQTRRYHFDYPELGRRDTTVTYLLEPIAEGTRVTVRHDGFAALRAAADHHAEGWEGFLKYLAKYVDRNEASA